MDEEELVPLVEIRRDWLQDCWVCVGLGAHSALIPLPAEAEAQLVVSYLKAKAKGKLRVRVDLT